MNKLAGIVLVVIALLGSPAGAQQQPGQSPIRVGLTASLSGDYEPFGREQLQGVEMWVEAVNSRGALLGRPVQLVVADDHSDPATAARLYREMIAGGQVDLLLGPYSSEITLVVGDVAERYGKPLLAIGASASEIWQRGHRYVFGMDAPAATYFDLALESAHTAGITRIALLNANTGFAREVARGAQDKAATMGLQIVLAEEYAADSVDFELPVQHIVESGAELVLGASYFEDSVGLVRELRRQRVPLRAVAFTVGPGLADFGRELGAEGDGVMGVVQWLRSSRMPGAQDFSWRYRQRYGQEAGVHAAMGYAAGQALEAAVRLAGTTLEEPVRRQLAGMKFRSLVGHYQVDGNGMQIAKPTYLMQWQGGRQVLVLPQRFAEGPLQSYQP